MVGVTGDDGVELVETEGEGRLERAQGTGPEGTTTRVLYGDVARRRSGRPTRRVSEGPSSVQICCVMDRFGSLVVVSERAVCAWGVRGAV